MEAAPAYHTWKSSFRAEECFVTLPDGTEWPAIVFDSLQDFLAMTKEIVLDNDFASQLHELQNIVGRAVLLRQTTGQSLSIDLCIFMGDSYPTESRFFWTFPPETIVRRGPLMEIYLSEYASIGNPNPDQMKMLQAILATINLNVSAAAPTSESNPTGINETTALKPAAKSTTVPDATPARLMTETAAQTTVIVQAPNPDQPMGKPAAPQKAAQIPAPQPECIGETATLNQIAHTTVPTLDPPMATAATTKHASTVPQASHHAPAPMQVDDTTAAMPDSDDAPMEDATRKETPNQDDVRIDDATESMDIATPRKQLAFIRDDSPCVTPKTRPNKRSSAKKAKRKDDDIIRPSVETPSDREIVLVLKKGGYKFHQGTWTRPGGKETYESLNDLRTHLCRNGVNCKCKSTREESVACQCWSVDEKGSLFRWVRCSIISKPLKQYRPLESARASELLVAIGFTYGREGFTLPGFYDEPLHDGPLVRELAKVGLPASCNFSAISELDLYSLECFIAFAFKFTLYVCIWLFRLVTHDIWHSTYNPGRRRSSFSPTLARRTRLPTSPSTVVTNDDGETNAKKRPSGSTRKGAKKRRSSPVPSPPEVEYHVTEATPESESTPLMASRLTTSRLKPFSSIQETFSSEPVFHGSDAEKLRSASAALSLSNRFDSPSFQSDQPSRFTESISAVYKFLQDSVDNRTHGVAGDNNGLNALYVCGVPGIGKTSGVHWCCDQFVQANKDMIESQLAVCKINASSLITGDSDPLKDVVRVVKQALKMPFNTSLQLIRKRLTRSVSGGLAKMFLVIVADEIDALMTSKKLKEVFDALMELSNDPMCQFALIGISNSISDEKYVLMQSSVATVRPTAISWFSIVSHNHL